MSSHSDERTPLLSNDESDSVSTHADSASNKSHPTKKQIGVFSATFIIFNRIVGAGIFATPSTILRFSGSVGVSLFMWVFGGLFALTGMYVYIIWGSALPRNGAEKNYLEFLFKRPPFLITCMFGAQSILLIWAAGSAQIFSEYLLRALDLRPPPSNPWPQRLASFAIVLFATILHGTSIKWGLRLQNCLGILKLVVLSFVIITGIVAGSGKLREGVQKPDNFSDAFEGTVTSPSSLCFALFNVIYSFHGYSNANYALGEVQNPQRTIRIAGFSAVLLITTFYILVILSYLAGVAKADIVNSGQLVAALLFNNVYGPKAERWLSACVALSAGGGVLGITFSQGRVNQALGKEGILPFSSFFASSKRYGAPLAGMSLHCLMCFIVIFLLPPGDAYQFILNCSQYPVAIINTVITIGLVYLLSRRGTASTEATAFSRYRSVPLYLACSLFLLVNIFLVIVPLTPPPKGGKPYKKLPYWLHSVAAWVVLGLGAIYWASWAVVGPRLGKYRLVSEEVEEEGKDSGKVRRFTKVPVTTDSDGTTS